MAKHRPTIAVTIIAFNEEKNIERALKSVTWADEVVVVDSGSTDRTVELALGPNVKVYTHRWEGYGNQKNFAQSMAQSDWILNIDADEEVSEALSAEIVKALATAESLEIRGYFLPRKTFYIWKWIGHGGWYPNYLLRLTDRRFSSWTEPKVHEVCKVAGRVEKLTQPLLHYAFSSIQEQVTTNLEYAKLGALELQAKSKTPSMIKLVFKPVGKFIETYWIKKGFLDGVAGFIISVNAAHSIFLKYALLIQEKYRSEHSDHR